jgi:hypothetical protein
MDIVITYVDGNDPEWKKDYEKYTNVPVMQKRFRDWGTLKYLLRGIEVNMPFIKNVYLVVSHLSQVPQWADLTTLQVVLHKDIIPAEHLPTFNSNPIEMHLHKIEGLDEEYLYFNDDLFPVLPCSPEDFFRDGKGVLGFTDHWFAAGMYKKICRNSDRLAREAADQAQEAAAQAGQSRRILVAGSIGPTSKSLSLSATSAWREVAAVIKLSDIILLPSKTPLLRISIPIFAKLSQER